MVVMIVSIMAALAIPLMGKARLDRHVYDDAGYILQGLRTARTRAVSRGAATMVRLTANGTTNRGRIEMYEAVTQNIVAPAAPGGPSTITNDANNRTPFGSCTAAVWTGATVAALGNVATGGNALFVDGYDMNNAIEATANIQTQLSSVTSSGAVTPNTVSICFSPLGRTYVDDTSTLDPVFLGKPSLIALRIKVSRGEGIERRVVVPPSGMARMRSMPAGATWP